MLQLTQVIQEVVVNRVGELVGLVSLKINMPNIEGMGFAIPIDAHEKL